MLHSLPSKLMAQCLKLFLAREQTLSLWLNAISSEIYRGHIKTYSYL